MPTATQLSIFFSVFAIVLAIAAVTIGVIIASRESLSEIGTPLYARKWDKPEKTGARTFTPVEKRGTLCALSHKKHTAYSTAESRDKHYCDTCATIWPAPATPQA